jgi:glycosyltransferase involved in cell wall biosynthesis
VRILIVTYSYPPVVNARALRWSALAEDWAQRGHEVLVIAAWQPGTSAVERENGVTVHRTAWRWTQRLRAGIASARTAPVQGGGSRGRWHPFLHRIWRSVYWPDTSCLWLPAALSAARKAVGDMRPEAVVSVSPTFSAVVAGMRLVGKLQPRPRWLVDLGDPFSFADDAPPNNFRLYGALNYAVERAAFRRADAIAVTTPETRDRYAELFAESATKLQVIPPLVAIAPGPNREPRGDRLALVYVGTLYQGIRNPRFMVALLRRLLERPVGRGLELHVYGDVQDCRAAFERNADLLGHRLFVHGAVARQSALEAMRDAGVLVNIGNRTSYQLPSKLVEYAALGKPILNFAGAVQDSSARFLASYPRHLSLDARNDVPTGEQVSACEEFLENVRQKRLPEVPSGWVAPYRVAAISQRYLELLRAGT